jgi:hypothetical protein
MGGAAKWSLFGVRTLALSAGPAWGLLLPPTKLSRSSFVRSIGHSATIVKVQRSSDSDGADRLADGQRANVQVQRRSEGNDATNGLAEGRRATVEMQRSSEYNDDASLAAKEHWLTDPTRRWTLGLLGSLAFSPFANAAVQGPVEAAAGRPSSELGLSSIYGGIINKSPLDPRSYRSLTLNNGIEVWLLQFFLCAHVLVEIGFV